MVGLLLMAVIFCSQNYVDEVKSRDLHLQLSGSWTVGVGDQDQCLHLWKYEGGYKAIDEARDKINADKVKIFQIYQRVNVITYLPFLIC